MSYFEDGFRNQLQIDLFELIQNGEKLQYEDEDMNEKLDYMYNHLDFDHDRAKVRDKFLNEVNKRVSLKDIGETLDKLIYENKAENIQHYKLNEHYNLHSKRATKDFSSEDFKWSGRLFKTIDPKYPIFIDDPDQIDAVPNESIQEKLHRVYDKIKYMDENRDHSYSALSNDEKNEIALFHSIKQDPYFKHYIYNHLR